MKNRKNKKLFIFLFVLFFILSFSACNINQNIDISKYADYKYIASKTSKKFHTRSCFLGKRIAPEDAKFFDSRTDAIDAGYTPDTVCNP